MGRGTGILPVSPTGVSPVSGPCRAKMALRLMGETPMLRKAGHIATGSLRRAAP